MTIKKCFFATIGVTSMLLLAACSTPKTNHQHPLAGNAPLNQICQHLKEEIAMDTVYNVPDELGNNPTKQAQLYKEYEKYHCDQFFAEAKSAR